MNERIKELAEQAGFTHKQSLGVYQFYEHELEKFAELVAAQEREECAAMCMAVPRTGAYFARLIRARGTT